VQASQKQRTIPSLLQLLPALLSAAEHAPDRSLQQVKVVEPICLELQARKADIGSPKVQQTVLQTEALQNLANEASLNTATDNQHNPYLQMNVHG
jgi:hypothetical protein